MFSTYLKLDTCLSKTDVPATEDLSTLVYVLTNSYGWVIGKDIEIVEDTTADLLPLPKPLGTMNYGEILTQEIIWGILQKEALFKYNTVYYEYGKGVEVASAKLQLREAQVMLQNIETARSEWITRTSKQFNSTFHNF